MHRPAADISPNSSFCLSSARHSLGSTLPGASTAASRLLQRNYSDDYNNHSPHHHHHPPPHPPHHPPHSGVLAGSPLLSLSSFHGAMSRRRDSMPVSAAALAVVTGSTSRLYAAVSLQTCLWDCLFLSILVPNL